MADGIGANFGDWLKRRRKELGITQDDLADSVGLSPVMLRKLEAGSRRPSGQIASLLADALGVSSEDRDAFVVFARTDRAWPASSPAPAPAKRDVAQTPWRTSYLQQTNLPAPLTALIGREQEVEVARNRLLDPKIRLLTLTGTPGIGKTRLALQVAYDLVDHFEDGIFLVELAPITDPDLVLPAIAASLGLKEAAIPTERALLDYVRERRLLLLLDNFEQVLDAAPLVVKLLEVSPWLKTLVTSREALHVRGEHRFPVPPLGLPDPSLVSTEGARELSPTDALAACPSVALFVSRAQDVAADFELTEENAKDVAAICRELEGLPLAIELTAARVRLLTVGQIRTALQGEGQPDAGRAMRNAEDEGRRSGNTLYSAQVRGRLKLLTGGARDLAARHRTLREAISWSYELLDESERTLFRRLSVFAGGFASEAVYAVCNSAEFKRPELGQDDSMPFDPLEGISSLVDKSLVSRVAVPSERGKEPGAETPRFRMLETIRDYAGERLHESGEQPELEEEVARWAHAVYFTKLAEEAVPHLMAGKEKSWFLRLDSEHENLRSALAYLLGEAKHGKVDGVEYLLRLCGALGQFWYVRGFASEGRGWLLAALKAHDSWLSSHMTEEHSESVRKLMAERAVATSELGLLSWFVGDYDAARQAYGSSLSLGRELGDRLRIAKSLNNLGMLATEQNDQETARHYYEEGLALAQELGDQYGISRLLNNLGVVAHREGDYAAARRYYEESLEMRRARDDKHGLARTLNNIGSMANLLGDTPAARSAYGEALQLSREWGDKALLSRSLVGMGDVYVVEGDYATAHSYLREALIEAREADHKVGIFEAFESFAVLSVEIGEWLRAARLCGAADTLRSLLNAPRAGADLANMEKVMTVARRELGPTGCEVALAEGQAMSLAEAADYALG